MHNKTTETTEKADSDTAPKKVKVETIPLTDEKVTVLRWVLDSGRGNVIDMEAIGIMRESVAAAHKDPPHAIVIDHTGKHFSFGASVEEHRPASAPKMLAVLHALASELLDLHVPVVAAVKGMCLGGGLELALLADYVVASPDARFGQPEAVLGVFAPIGSALLPRIIGARRATDLLLSGRNIDAQTAMDWGLVGTIAKDPSGAAIEWVTEHLVPKSKTSLRHIARAARETWKGAFLEDLTKLEGYYVSDLMETHDACEGIEAFLEKRTPKWEDR